VEELQCAERRCGWLTVHSLRLRREFKATVAGRSSGVLDAAKISPCWNV
jgi:hypothetical protein